MTRIHGRIAEPKTSIRIEANGSLDELNVAIGEVRTRLARDHEWQPILHGIQITLMTVMSQVATRSDMRHANPNTLDHGMVDDVERLIDRISERTSPADNFILPSGTPVASALHLARVATRRSERRLWQLHDIDPVPELITGYINRLSDLFFVMARYDIQESDNSEEVWKEFGYKRNLK